ncbi:catecholate siderophore receptor [Azomonas agilis]|uniref:Catecholate siderophore receptor n=1 Tax=Azomonas agilis TaxID=116849 RepID=A0A562I0V6_9GAMM|nr:TonB-dependent siderophore receptor [Azomonas agilis]TWH64285.1 catecholate siderophore receptor [Azomonas agilis]
MSTQSPRFQYRYHMLSSAIGVAISALPLQAVGQSSEANVTPRTQKQPAEVTEKQVSSGSGDEPIALEAVSVTGQQERGSYKVDESVNRRYTAPLRETPKTITVISEQVIKDTGSLTLVDALRTVSGITFGSGEGGNPAGDRPIIRGFSAESDQFVDGLRDVASQTREIFNIEQIEVSKGPGSAFVGAGSTGGAINMSTKSPKRENFNNLSYTWGTDQTRRYTLDTNYVLTDQVAFRLNVMSHDANVAGRDKVDVNRWGVAPSLQIGFDTPTRLLMSYYHLDTDDMPDYGVPVEASAGAGKKARPIGGDRDRFYGYSSDYRDSTTDSGYLKFEHDFNENITLTNAFRMVRTTLDYVVTSPAYTRVNGADYVSRGSRSRDSTSDGWVNQTDLKIKFNTFGWEHNLIAGVEASYEDVHNRPYAFSVNGSCAGTSAVPLSSLLSSGRCTSLTNPTYDQGYTGVVTPGVNYTDTRTETLAAFMFDTIKFNDQWSFNFGLRHDDFDTESRGVRTVNSQAERFNFENNTNFVSYQAGIVFNPLPNGSIYYAQSVSYNPVGETSGEGADGLAATNQDLERERNDNWEIGTKWEFFDKRLGINAAFFRTEKDNARFTDQAGATSNIGKVVVKGVELGINGTIMDNWDAFVNYTYLDSEIEKGGAVNLGTTAAPNYVDGANDGNHVPSTPRNSLSLWTTYKVKSDLIIGGGANYMDQRYGNATNTIEVSSYWRYDAMAAYQVNENLDFQLNIQNLTDKRYFDQIRAGYAHVAPGRTALLATNIKF